MRAFQKSKKEGYAALGASSPTYELEHDSEKAAYDSLVPTCLTILKCIAFWIVIPFLTSSAIVVWRDPLRCNGIEFRKHEFGPARDFIEKATEVFTGTPVFADDGTANVERLPGVKQYIGGDEEVEANWDELVRDRIFYVNEEEAKTYFPHNYRELYHEQGMGWEFGLDVFHTLHCVNQIRLTLQNTNKDPQSYRSYHIEHCLDLIRQTVQCHADLTPMPGREIRGSPQHNVSFNHFFDSDQTHTCRNFWTLRKFLDERKKADDVKRKNLVENERA